jgi:hypothetical protein
MMKIISLLLIISVSAFAGTVEYGAHAGGLFPTGNGGDFYSTSPIFGVNIYRGKHKLRYAAVQRRSR